MYSILVASLDVPWLLCDRNGNLIYASDRFMDRFRGRTIPSSFYEVLKEQITVANSAGKSEHFSQNTVAVTLDDFHYILNTKPLPISFFSKRFLVKMDTMPSSFQYLNYDLKKNVYRELAHDIRTPLNTIDMALKNLEYMMKPMEIDAETRQEWQEIIDTALRAGEEAHEHTRILSFLNRNHKDTLPLGDFTVFLKELATRINRDWPNHKTEVHIKNTNDGDCVADKELLFWAIPKLCMLCLRSMETPVQLSLTVKETVPKRDGLSLPVQIHCNPISSNKEAPVDGPRLEEKNMFSYVNQVLMQQGASIRINETKDDGIFCLEFNLPLKEEEIIEDREQEKVTWNVSS